MSLKLLEQKGLMEERMDRRAVESENIAKHQIGELNQYIQEIHAKQLNDVENFQNCHRLYLKASERFDQKMELIVNMERGYQTLLQ